MSTAEQNYQALSIVERKYPAREWSRSVHDEPGTEIMVTFQRYSDDAEDRYIISDGKAELI